MADTVYWIQFIFLGGVAAVPVWGNLDRYWMSGRNFFIKEWNLHFSRRSQRFVFEYVFMGWSSLPNALRPCQMYCAPPNLGITGRWICRLNFAQRSFFSSFRFFNPEILHSEPPASPSRRTSAQKFYVLKNFNGLSRVWSLEPWISRRARYPETTVAVTFKDINADLMNRHARFVDHWAAKAFIYRAHHVGVGLLCAFRL